MELPGYYRTSLRDEDPRSYVNAYAPNPSRQGRGIRRPSPSAGMGACFMVLCPLVRRFGGSRNPGKFRETRDWAQALLR